MNEVDYRRPFIRQDSILRDWPIWACALFMLGLLWFLGSAAISEGKEKDRLLAACMSDGHKEYECHAMLDSHTNSAIIPIYMGR